MGKIIDSFFFPIVIHCPLIAFKLRKGDILGHVIFAVRPGCGLICMDSSLHHQIGSLIDAMTECFDECG